MHNGDTVGLLTCAVARGADVLKICVVFTCVLLLYDVYADAVYVVACCNCCCCSPLH